jgi:Domain of unknown function (DUF4266)
MVAAVIKRIGALVCLAVASSLVGCVHVAPHEREYLARPSMDPKTDKGEAAFQAHLRESREGATSGYGASGGGCGCN